MGGFDGTRQLSSVERYDTEKHEWEFMAPIKVARSALSLTALDGKLWAMGGYDGTSFSTVVEVYDPVKNEWIDGVALTSGRSGHAAAVIYQPSSIASIDASEALVERGGTSGNRSFDNTEDRAPSTSSGRPSMLGGMRGGFGGGCSSSNRDCCENGEHCPNPDAEMLPKLVVNGNPRPTPPPRLPRVNSPNISHSNNNQNTHRRSNDLEDRLRNYLISRRLRIRNSRCGSSASKYTHDDNFDLPYNIDVDLLNFKNRIYNNCKRCALENKRLQTDKDTIKPRHTCPGAILKRAVIRFLGNFSSDDRHYNNGNNRPGRLL